MKRTVKRLCTHAWYAQYRGRLGLAKYFICQSAEVLAHAKFHSEGTVHLEIDALMRQHDATGFTEMMDTYLSSPPADMQPVLGELMGIAMNHSTSNY